MVLKGLHYTKEHEWAKVEGDSAIVGITDHAQQMLGEITFVELPAVGKKVRSHDELGVVESSKSASDVYSPVSGMVTQINSELQSTPELINDDCYGVGWICKMTISDRKGLDELMDAGQYEDYLKGL